MTIQLDRAVVEKLRNVGGDALVRRMFRLFLTTSADAFCRIDTALESGALPVVAAAAHTLYSSAAQLCLTETAQLAERIEKGARSGNADGLRVQLEQLSQSLRNVTAALDGELEKLPRPPRIAVIDDSEDVRVLLRLILEWHYDVTEYAAGSSALGGLRRFPVDLLIIDYSLPDMNGIDLLKCIKADARLRGIPSIALTALAPEGGVDYVAAGFDLHVRKPILDTDELVSSIDHLLRSDNGQ